MCFLHALVVLRYLPKLKKGMALIFSAYFLDTFSTKMFLTKDRISSPSFSIRPNFFIKTSIK